MNSAWRRHSPECPVIPALPRSSLRGLRYELDLPENEEISIVARQSLCQDKSHAVTATIVRPSVCHRRLASRVTRIKACCITWVAKGIPMRRVMIVAILLVLACGFLPAQDVTAGWDSYFKAGDTALSVGVGVGVWTVVSIAVYPGFEQVIVDFKIADVVPLGIGVAARGVVNPYAGSGYAGVNIGAGLFVPFHFSLKGLDISLLNRLDIYTAPGIAINIDLGNFWGTNSTRFGFVSYAGFNYFLSDSLAVFIEGNYWNYYSGGSVGVLLKF